MTESEARKRANKRYKAKQVQWGLQVPPAFDDQVKDYMILHGIQSRTALIKVALIEYMDNHADECPLD